MGNRKRRALKEEGGSFPPLKRQRDSASTRSPMSERGTHQRAGVGEWFENSARGEARDGFKLV